MGKKDNQGIKSKNVVRKPVRTGQQKKRTIPAGVAQLGQRVGNHITNRDATAYGGVDLFAGTGFKSELGNSVAARTKEGPGGSREVMPSGSQSMTGPVNRGEPMPKAKALFPGWEK